ncbi:MAG: bifunctional pyr operon transcriptional regulator/uracil phosphoribosyltransferase PyrR [Desulfobulbus sp.]|uniref:bifunctional pyr operon transcriptional regulator/uracil phosphoribosyltransferase PyrR n=1 Tax=uncultured Desulfobulbus sp. TaxID=239745 RepID=UPI001B54B3DD|nr:bifunctional pyr operon transcriptional regulator/uracil phosphoribosyltransferase PyrR [uncultured Desulfobulbus sp.]MBP7516523.1 bifunctional pyr operon transcriptional regulator/uracil phosphoribosyltransferase PyrR [Desulfobulbus sp.]
MTARTIMIGRDIDRSLDRISLEIVERNHGVADLSIVGIHTGGVFLAQRIKRRIEEREGVTLPAGNLDITLYRDDWSLISQNPIVKKSEIGFLLEDRRVILVDDVLFTGRTIRAALDAIMDYGRPLSIQLAVLIDRGGRELPIQPDYVGMAVAASAGERVDVLLDEKDGRDEVVLSRR